MIQCGGEECSPLRLYCGALCQWHKTSVLFRGCGLQSCNLCQWHKPLHRRNLDPCCPVVGSGGSTEGPPNASFTGFAGVAAGPRCGGVPWRLPARLTTMPTAESASKGLYHRPPPCRGPSAC